MDIEKLIEAFEKMDITKPFSKKPNPQMGSINVRDTEFGLMVSMLELKKNIGELDNSAKLKYLNGLNLLIPKGIFFDTDNDRANIIEQAFFQDANDWYDFIEAYKEYLKNSLLDNRSSEKQQASFKDKKKDNLAERLDLLDQKFKVNHVVTLDEAEGQSNDRFQPGSIGLAYPPIPVDPKDAFQLFQDYYGTYQFEVQKSLFFDTYRSFENENAINAEINILEDFIKAAVAISYKDACENINNSNPIIEYKRLTGGFYDDYLMTWVQQNINSNAASVYGKYVLFYEYLKNKKRQMKRIANSTLKKLDPYFSNEYGKYNYDAWSYLYKEIDISGIFEPTLFFKTAQKEFEFFNENILSFSKINRHFEKLKEDKNKLYFLLLYLVPLIDLEYRDIPGRGNLVFVVDDYPALKYIRGLYKEIESEFAKQENEKSIPTITSDNFNNPPPGIDIIGLTEPEAYKKFLDLQDKGLAKDPLFGKQYYNWVINETTLEKDNYILSYEKYGLDEEKVKNYDVVINRAKNRLKAIEQTINDVGLDKITGTFPDINKETENKETELSLKLEMFFATTKKYKTVMDLLVEKGHCQPDTYIWKDEKNGNKSFLAAILKYLHKQGYLKDNKKLSNQQIQLIAKNTFGWEIGLDTIKKAKFENFDLKFIPFASKID